jgi:hypothetical protein
MVFLTHDTFKGFSNSEFIHLVVDTIVFYRRKSGLWPDQGRRIVFALAALASDLKFHFSGSVEVSFLKLPRKFRVVLQRAPEVAGCRPSYRHPDARLFVIST